MPLALAEFRPRCGCRRSRRARRAARVLRGLPARLDRIPVSFRETADVFRRLDVLDVCRRRFDPDARRRSQRVDRRERDDRARRPVDARPLPDLKPIPGWSSVVLCWPCGRFWRARRSPDAAAGSVDGWRRGTARSVAASPTWPSSRRRRSAGFSAAAARAGRSSARLPFLRQPRESPHHVVRDAATASIALRLRNVPPVPQGATTDGGRGPVLPAVRFAVATLPLDPAAVMQSVRWSSARAVPVTPTDYCYRRRRPARTYASASWSKPVEQVPRLQNRPALDLAPSTTTATC